MIRQTLLPYVARLLLATTCLTSVAAAQGEPAGSPPVRDPSAIDLESGLDHIGAEVQSFDVDGRPAYYIVDGNPDGRAVVFIGGL